MNIVCTNCRTRYSIADSLIPPQGARFKCRRCSEVIPIEAPVIELAPTELEVIPPPEPAAATPRAAAPHPEPEPASSLAPELGRESVTSVPAAPDGGFETSSGPLRFSAPPSFAEPAQASEPVPIPAPSPILPPTPTPVSSPAPATQAAPAAVPPSGPSPAALSPAAASATPGSGGSPIPEGLSPEERARHEKARRLARVLASDIAIYNREKRERGIKDGNLVAVLGYEIKKSWEIYKERVTPEFANATPYFRDALNEMLAEGKKVF
jgi:predicted Zn finger-like uncharacterized protein